MTGCCWEMYKIKFLFCLLGEMSVRVFYVYLQINYSFLLFFVLESTVLD